LFSRVWDENRFVRHHVFVKTSPKEVQLAEVGPRFELKRTLQGLFVTADGTYVFLQPMKYGWAQLNNPKLSENGCSHIIHERLESVAYCQTLGHPAPEMTNKPILGLPRSGPADQGLRTTKVCYPSRSVDMLYSHEVNLVNLL
jgi:hypothetical protein